MKDMGSVLEKNNQLLKLIVQKMEIHTEDEAWDEGVFVCVCVCVCESVAVYKSHIAKGCDCGVVACGCGVVACGCGVVACGCGVVACGCGVVDVV